MEKLREHRQGGRAAFHKSVQYEHCEVQAGRFVNCLKAGECVDVSDGGMGLSTDIPMQGGEVLKVYLPLDVTGTRLPVYSEVMWSRAVGEKFRAGLRFLA